MQISGVFKLLEVTRSGETKHEETFVHCSAISYDKSEQFIMIKAFGTDADFIIRNLNGVRRAFVTGELVMSEYEETVDIIKTVAIDGKKRKIKFPIVETKTGLSLHVNSIQFLDKKKDDEYEDVTDECDDDDIILCCDDEEVAGDEDVVIGDDGEIEISVDAEPDTKANKKKADKSTTSARRTTRTTRASRA